MFQATRVCFAGLALIAVVMSGASFGSAVIVVDTLADVEADDSQCSLREAIINANGGNQGGSADCSAGGGVEGTLIRFDQGLSGGHITLNGGLSGIMNPIWIEGPETGNPAGLTLDADGHHRITSIINDGELDIQDMTLTGGLMSGGTIGGAIAVVGGSLVMRRMRLEGNHASGNGGSLSLSNGNLLMIDSELANNTAGSQGGAIYAKDSTIELIRTTVAENSSELPGNAVYLLNSTLSMLNSTISGNSSPGPNAALRVAASDLTLVHSTIAFNESSAGEIGISVVDGGLGPSSVTMHNSLIVQADASSVACHFWAGTDVVSVGTLSTHSSCTGTATAAELIGLGPLADHGGYTRTHSLAPDSVAINAAGNCLHDHGISSDQRRAPRPGGDVNLCDAGAWEFQSGSDRVFRDRFMAY